MFRVSIRPCPCLHVPVSRTQHAWLQGSDPHNGGSAQRFYPVTSHLRLPPPSPLCLVLVLALPCIASPRTCHLPNSTCTCTNKAGCLAVWTRLRVCARSAFQVCRPGSSFYARQYHGTLCLSICQSTRQPVHQLTGRPKAAKVGNGTTRFGLLFGRGTVSPRLPAVCTPSCSSPQQEMTEGCPFTPRTMTQLNSSA